MKNFLEQCIKTKCEIVVDEENLTKVLEVLRNNRIDSNLKIGDCGWVEAKKLYVMFSATGRQMASIKAALRKADFKEIIVLTNTNCWAKVEKLI